MVEPIRIAQVMGKMNGGGVEAVVMNYYRFVDRTKVQFDFIVDEDSTLFPRDEIESLGGRIFIVPPYQQQFRYQCEVESLFRENHWAIVHSHINTLSVFPLRAAKRAGVPVRIAHSHSTANSNEHMKTALKLILRTQANRYPTERFACGEYAGKWLFGNKADFTLIPNGIDLCEFAFSQRKRDSLRKRLGVKPGTFVVLHLGRFVEQKNHSFLIETFAELHRRNPNSVLLLAGDGPLLQSVKNSVEALGISDSVRFLGQRRDADELYSAADAFCLPSLYEGLPVVAIEAEASGLPILMSDNVSDEAVITSRAMRLSLAGGAAEWANSLLSFSRGARIEQLTSQDVQQLSVFDIKRDSMFLANKYMTLCGRSN